MHRYKLSVDDALHGHSDFKIIKFYYDSVNENHEHARFLYELIALRDNFFFVFPSTSTAPLRGPNFVIISIVSAQHS